MPCAFSNHTRKWNCVREHWEDGLSLAVILVGCQVVAGLEISHKKMWWKDKKQDSYWTRLKQSAREKKWTDPFYNSL